MEYRKDFSKAIKHCIRYVSLKQYNWKKNCVLDLNKLSMVKVKPIKQIKKMNVFKHFVLLLN